MVAKEPAVISDMHIRGERQKVIDNVMSLSWNLTTLLLHELFDHSTFNPGYFNFVHHQMKDCLGSQRRGVSMDAEEISKTKFRRT